MALARYHQNSSRCRHQSAVDTLKIYSRKHRDPGFETGCSGFSYLTKPDYTQKPRWQILLVGKTHRTSKATAKLYKKQTYPEHTVILDMHGVECDKGRSLVTQHGGLTKNMGAST
nr:hypothetical transcript [Hymenolepis microstoma]